MKDLSAKEFITLLKKNRFVYERTRGDHAIFKRNHEMAVVNTCGRGFNKMIARRLIKQFGLV